MFYPKDFDEDLTVIARSSCSLIRAINSYHVKENKYPAKLTDLFPDYLFPIADELTFYQPGNQALKWRNWLYEPDADAGYSLSFKLGWDSCLGIIDPSKLTDWVYIPGDGSPNRPIKLLVAEKP